jgi:Na+/proline symporter
MQIGVLDWAIIAAYVVSLAVIGIIASRRVKNTGEYFLGGRRFGKILMIAQSFGVGTHADMPVSLAGAVYTSGISAIWYQWKNLFAMPFYWIMAPVFRRVRRTTTAEMMEDRYGAAISVLYVVFAFIFFTINIASILKGAAKVLNEVFGGGFSANHIVLMLASIFILYSFVGGLVASVWTDVIQGALIIVLSFLLIPLGWGLTGGLSGIKHTLPLSKLSLATSQETGLWLIFMLTLNGILGIMAQPHIMAAVSSGKDEHSCRVGFFHGTLVKRICTVGWAIVGLMVAVMVARNVFGIQALADPEDAFGFACRHLLSEGPRGLLIASVVGASLASCSALMVDSGALLTQGLYRTRLSPGKSDQHYLWVGRVSGLVVVLLAILYALFLVKRVLYSFLLTETLSTYIGISIVVGLVWRRANRWGAAASILVALLTNFALYHLMHRRADYWDPNVFLFSLTAGLLSIVLISLITIPEPKASIALFFDKLDMPSDDPETEKSFNACLDPDKPQLILCQIQRSAGVGRQLIITNLLHLRRGGCGHGFWRAYREDLKGLCIGFALTAGLVGGLWLFLQL